MGQDCEFSRPFRCAALGEAHPSSGNRVFREDVTSQHKKAKNLGGGIVVVYFVGRSLSADKVSAKRNAEKQIN